MHSDREAGQSPRCLTSELVPGANGGSSSVTPGGLQRLLGKLVSKADSRNLQLKKRLHMVLLPSGLTSTSFVLRPAVSTAPGQPGGADSL